MITLYLARHGETHENVAQLLQGHMPGQLTERGKAQAEELRQKLSEAGIAFDRMLVSDLKRTMDTAQIVNRDLQLPLTPCPLLRERDWGSFTGRHVTAARHGQLPDDAETVEQMFQRAQRFLLYIRSEFDGECILAVGHGLFSRCLIASLSGQTIRDIPRMMNAEVRQLLIE